MGALIRTAVVALLVVVGANAQTLDSGTAARLRQAHASTYDLLAGQVPSHGSAWWGARKAVVWPRIASDPAARVDYAVALIELGQLDEARAQLELVPSESAYANFALWNLGIIDERNGRYDVAHEKLARAKDGFLPVASELAELHMKMVRWLNRSWEGGQPRIDFLGTAYGRMMAYEEEFVRLLERYLLWTQRHPDAIFERADLASIESRNLAQVGFVRAMVEGHPSGDDWVLSRTGHDPQLNDRVKADLQAAADWLRQFHEVEAEMLATRPVREVTLAAVDAELQRRGVRRTTLQDYGLDLPDMDEAVRNARFEPPAWMIVALALLALAVLVYVRRMALGR